MEAISAAAIEVEDLDGAGLLEAASETERLDRMVQHRKLKIAYQWCIGHPATAESGTATWATQAPSTCATASPASGHR